MFTDKKRYLFRVCRGVRRNIYLWADFIRLCYFSSSRLKIIDRKITILGMLKMTNISTLRKLSKSRNFWIFFLIAIIFQKMFFQIWVFNNTCNFRSVFQSIKKLPIFRKRYLWWIFLLCLRLLPKDSTKQNFWPII